jgi:hypothetical protein
MSTGSKRYDEEDGVIGGKMAGYPDFGRAMLKDFQFEEGCKLPQFPASDTEQSNKQI